MKLVATRKEEQNQSVADPWTVVHFSAGLAVGLMAVPLRWTLPLAVTYEVLEQLLERKRFGQALCNTAGLEKRGIARLDVGGFAACPGGGRDQGPRGSARRAWPPHPVTDG